MLAFLLFEVYICSRKSEEIYIISTNSPFCWQIYKQLYKQTNKQPFILNKNINYYKLLFSG